MNNSCISLEKERQRHHYEAYLRQRNPHNLMAYKEGIYEDPMTEQGWQLWQAACALFNERGVVLESTAPEDSLPGLGSLCLFEPHGERLQQAMQLHDEAVKASRNMLDRTIPREEIDRSRATRRRLQDFLIGLSKSFCLYQEQIDRAMRLHDEAAKALCERRRLDNSAEDLSSFMDEVEQNRRRLHAMLRDWAQRATPSEHFSVLEELGTMDYSQNTNVRWKVGLNRESLPQGTRLFAAL